jgi:hypothetical protein
METYDSEDGESRTLLRVEKIMETWRALEIMKVLTEAVAADEVRARREGNAVLIDIDGTREILDREAIERIKEVLRKLPAPDLTEGAPAALKATGGGASAKRRRQGAQAA